MMIAANQCFLNYILRNETGQMRDGTQTLEKLSLTQPFQQKQYETRFTVTMKLVITNAQEQDLRLCG